MLVGIEKEVVNAAVVVAVVVAVVAAGVLPRLAFELVLLPVLGGNSAFDWGVQVVPSVNIKYGVLANDPLRRTRLTIQDRSGARTSSRLKGFPGA